MIGWHQALEALHRLTSPVGLHLLAQERGIWLYAILFAVVFVETGLVILPFLPGDSLLFAVGALGALPESPLHLPTSAMLFVIAAFLGDSLNYGLGQRLRPAVERREGTRWLNRKHLQAAHAFYERYGGKTIILARFVPILRTFAPFVAGMGEMEYPRFLRYNLVGACLWVGLVLGAGRAFGALGWVQSHFEAVVVAIITISVLPAVVEYVRGRRS